MPGIEDRSERTQEIESQKEYLKKQIEILSKTNFDKVKEMHKGFGSIDPEIPNIRDSQTRKLRASLIFEETKELLHELGFSLGLQEVNSKEFVSDEIIESWNYEISLKPIEVEFDLKKIAKESADVKVVVYGTDAALGIDGDIAFDAVHQSNMSKIGPAGKVIKREDGKILKGPHYREPDMSVIYSVVKLR